MFNFIKQLLKPKIILGEGKNSYHAIHGGWGDHIQFFKVEDVNEPVRQIWGHMPWDRFPKDGQILRSLGQTKSRMKLWKIVNVKRCDDPPDMFFANAEFLGYSDDGYTLVEALLFIIP